MIGIAQIQMAAKRILPYAVRTPLLYSDRLNAELGFNLWVKAEPLQRTGSFKFRGAMNAIAGLPDDDKPILAFSSGSHGQGIALSASIKGRHATIIMPEDAPATKIEKTRAYGGKLVFYDRYTENREDVVRDYQKNQPDMHLIPPFDDARIIAGQGTVGLEIAEQCSAAGITPDIALICFGGGGLASGSAIALKHAYPDVEIFSAEPVGFDDMARSLAAGKIVANPPESRSICDAVLTRQPGNLTFPICQKLLSGGKIVSDTQALQAMKIAMQYFQLLVEPGGAVALASALSPDFHATGKHVVVVASGGNVDPEQIEAALHS